MCVCVCANEHANVFIEVRASLWVSSSRQGPSLNVESAGLVRPGAEHAVDILLALFTQYRDYKQIPQCPAFSVGSGSRTQVLTLVQQALYQPSHLPGLSYFYLNLDLFCNNQKID